MDFPGRRHCRGSATRGANFQPIPHPCVAKLSAGSTTALRAPPTSASPKRVEEIALLFVVNDDVIYILPLRVLALECRGPRFSSFRDDRRHGHHNLVAFLYGVPGRAGVDPF